MNTITIEYILEKCGAEAFISAVIVCLISAFIKKRFKVGRRVQTAIEVALSFSIAAIVALITKNGDLSGIISGGLSTAGVALAVCGFICGDELKISQETMNTLVSLSDAGVDEITKAITSLPEANFTENEAKVAAVAIDRLLKRNKKD